MTAVDRPRGPAGQQFGRYDLTALIGRGAVGEVHRAYDREKERTVALKVLAPQFAADAEFQARFQRESRLVARLTNPHIVPIHDFGAIDDRLYLDMRLIDGRDLGVLIGEDGPLAPQRAVELVTQVASALSAAHAQGLVHRDVKPSNVLTVPTDVGGGDFAYLADFGVARSVGGDGSTTITGQGWTVGTLEYMAPERFRGDDVDHRVDVYALGCVLYECLTGAKPFAERGMAALMNAHVGAAIPRPSDVVSGIPAALDAVVATAMAKEPDDRYVTAGGFAAACQDAVSGAAPARAAAPTQVVTPAAPGSQAATPTMVPAAAVPGQRGRSPWEQAPANEPHAWMPPQGSQPHHQQGPPSQGQTRPGTGPGQQPPPHWGEQQQYWAGQRPPTAPMPGGPPPYNPFAGPPPQQPPPRRRRTGLVVALVCAGLLVLGGVGTGAALLASSSSSGSGGSGGSGAGPSVAAAPPAVQTVPPAYVPSAPTTTPPALSFPSASTPTTSYTIQSMFGRDNGSCESDTPDPGTTAVIECTARGAKITSAFEQYTGTPTAFTAQLRTGYSTFEQIRTNDCMTAYRTSYVVDGDTYQAYVIVYTRSPFAAIQYARTVDASWQQLADYPLIASNENALCSGG